ncbi:MAG: AAA family ATPase [Candidatus Omnitrophota bacterium]|nr:AAA family ATPase [Candidatus Omnitrophota bacterium]
MKPKRIFIAATCQNDGKTTVALGLIYNFKERFSNIGFIKPIGQRYLEEEGQKVDEDSVLIEKVFEPCNIKCGIKDMSPIAVERGFTEKYILNPEKEKISHKIEESFKKISLDKDLVIIEGTGHAGVGSVFDHSNATVAKQLDSQVILISSGGVGRPIDEILLNRALFKQEGVELLGVIINKVMPEKFEKVSELVKKGLKRFGIEVLGVIPYYPLLTAPTISHILEETDFKLLSGKSEMLSNKVTNIVVAAMQPHDALNYIKSGSLVITPGDREDIIMTILNLRFTKEKDLTISGVILTGGIVPHPTINEIISYSDIPFILAKQDTYTVAGLIGDLNVKIRPDDKDKIKTVVNMVREFVDIDKIYKGL